MTFQNKENTPSTFENWKKQNKLDFQNPDKLFSQLQNKDNISKEVFEKIFSDFETKTWKQGKEILENMSDFVDKNNLKDTESILSICLFIESISEKYWEKTEKAIKFLQKNKLILLIKLINNFRDNVNKKQKKYIEANKSKEEANKSNINIKETNKHLETEKLMNKKLREKLQKQIHKNAPEYEKPIQDQADNLKKQYPQISSDEAYLLSVAKLHNTDPEFSKKVKLDDKTLSILNAVEDKFSNLKIDKIVSQKAVKSEINEFSSSSTKFDTNIKESLTISEKPDLETQKLLWKKYKKYLDNIFQKIVLKNEGKLKVETLENNYNKYLNWEKTKLDKLFTQIWEKLNQKFKEDTKDFPKDYKMVALEEYTKTIFQVFDKAVWTENITKEFKEQNFNIEKSGNIELKFKYNETPLKFTITKEWNILMTNYLAKEKQDKKEKNKNSQASFQVKEIKLNNFFNFVWLETLLKPENINPTNLLSWEKSVKENLQNIILWQVENKLTKNKNLWNETMMKTEVKYDMQKQDLTHKLLSIYKPKVEDSYLLWENGKIWEERKWVYSLLNKFEKSINLKEKSFGVLWKLFSSDKFKQISESLWKWDDKLSTYELFQKLYFLNNEWDLNLNKISDFTKKIEKVSWNKDLKKLPAIEWFTWEYDGGKIKLNKEKEEDDDVFAKLEHTVWDYSKIDV